MPVFEYLSKNNKGRTVRGIEYAASKDDLKTVLLRRDLTVISIKETPPKPSEEKTAYASFLGGGRIRTFDLIVFCKELSSMLHGGVPIIKAFEVLSNEIKNKRFKKILGQVADSIRSGRSLSESLKKHPRAFSDLFIAIAEAGEEVGALDKMLERLSDYLTARERIHRKLLAAVAYPAFITLFFIIAMMFVTLVLIPRFKAIYNEIGAELPFLTNIIFNISDFLLKYYGVISLFFIAALSLCAYYFNTKSGRYLFDKAVLDIPVFGDIINKAAISKFARTLSTLLEQGISVTESLELVGRTSGNLVIEKASLKASKLITDGETIPDALKKVEVFPLLLIQMASVGVESGSLPNLLDKTADFYEDQTDVFLNVLTAVIEPALILILGLTFAVIVIGLYQPVFKLGEIVAGAGR